MSAYLEEVSFKLWPALETELYDGWVLRYASGYSRRSNSINPLGSSRLDLDDKVRYCEQWMTEHDLPVIFKMTDFSVPGDLDSYLDSCRYRKCMETSTQIMNLDFIPPVPSGRARMELLPREEWLGYYRQFAQLSEDSGEVLMRLVCSVQSCAYAAWYRNSTLVALALGIVSGEWLGLFNLMVRAEERRRGYGKRAVKDLLEWGKAGGCRNAFLQVVKGNNSAMAVYRDFGFEEQYRYWYRIRK